MDIVWRCKLLPKTIKKSCGENRYHVVDKPEKNNIGRVYRCTIFIICRTVLFYKGISEALFYGDLVYKFKRIIGKPNFSDRLKKTIKRYKKVGNNMDIL